MNGLILDWDGVFHDGRKGSDGGSSFSELDSMGLNLLRFGHFLETGNILPVAIITGERNETAEAFARREHVHAFGFYAKEKTRAIAPLESAWGSSADTWGFVFDDILDFGLAARVGLRAMVYREACDETYHYAVNQGWVDLTLQADHAVRRFAEGQLVQSGMWERVLEGRMTMSPEYQAYWALRQSIPLEIIDFSANP